MFSGGIGSRPNRADLPIGPVMETVFSGRLFRKLRQVVVQAGGDRRFGP